MRGQSLYDYCMEHEDKKYLLNEWDYEKNEKELGISPKDIGWGSHKKVWWKCSNGHSFCSIIYNRTYKSCGCKECAWRKLKYGRIKEGASGGNDLATNCDWLLRDWDYEKNIIKPNEVSIHSSQKVWWKCSVCGYNWDAVISSRFIGRGCPQCAKENKSSFPEQAIYYYLKQVYKGVVSGSRNLLGNNSELDIYIPEISTAIEYDGVSWHKDVEKDLKKNKLCEERGIKLIRIREEGLPNVEGSINIFRKNRLLDSDLEGVLKELFNLLCVKVDVNIERDKQLIFSQYVQGKKDNSLAVKYSEIAKEWHPTKNGNLTPENVSYGSGKKVWWLCSVCGNEWLATVGHRTFGRGCPECAKIQRAKILQGYNDLATTHPELVKGWNYEKNGDLSPTKISRGSGKKVWWKCSTCGHEYQRVIASQIKIKGIHCPECAKKNRKS